MPSTPNQFLKTIELRDKGIKFTLPDYAKKPENFAGLFLNAPYNALTAKEKEDVTNEQAAFFAAWHKLAGEDLSVLDEDTAKKRISARITSHGFGASAAATIDISKAIETLKNFEDYIIKNKPAPTTTTPPPIPPAAPSAGASIDTAPFPPLNPANITAKKFVEDCEKLIAGSSLPKGKYTVQATKPGADNIKDGVKVYDNSTDSPVEVAEVKPGTISLKGKSHEELAELAVILLNAQNIPKTQSLPITAKPKEFLDILISTLSKAGYTNAKDKDAAAPTGPAHSAPPAPTFP